MRRFFWGLVFLISALLLPISSSAQVTTVTATITDPNGFPWVGATIKAQLTSPAATVTVSSAAQCAAGGFGASPCQVPIQGTFGPVTLDTNGSFTMNLFDVTLVRPVNQQWVFTVSLSPGIAPPAGFGPQQFTYTSTGTQISGSSVSLSASLSGAAPSIGRGGVAIVATPFSATPNFAYAQGSLETSFSLQLTGNVTSSTVSGPFVGGSDIQLIICQDGTGGRTFAWPSTFLNVPTIPPTANGCTAGTWVFCGPAGGNACPANKWQNTDQTPVSAAVVGQISVISTGAIGDWKYSRTVAANSTTTLTDATGTPWLSTDVGKLISCVDQPNANAELTTPVSTITAFNSSSSITVSSAALHTATAYCAWGTQDETAAMLAAFTQARAQLSSIDFANIAASASPLLAYPQNVYCPPGGYAVSGPILSQTGGDASRAEHAVQFIGAGRNACVIYLLPTFNPGSTGLMFWRFVSGVAASGFEITGMNMQFTNAGSSPALLTADSDSGVHFFDFAESEYGNNTSYTAQNGSVIALKNCANYLEGIVVERVRLQGTGNSTAAGVNINSCDDAPVTFRENYLFSFNVNRYINNSGSRGGVGSHNFPLLFINEDELECNIHTTGCTTSVNSVFTDIGGWHIQFNGYIYTLDTTSVLTLNNAVCGAYTSDTSPIGCVSAAGNASIYLQGNALSSQGTDFIISAPSTVTLVDEGGNSWAHCASGVCTPLTAATYTTQGVSGGVVPTASVTHPKNTCYAVTGNLLATAQNLCTTLLDQNVQILNMTAQSGGTTPANSACATPPIITMSDGTRSFTLTMTTAKTQWSSAVDAVTGANQVFASGTTLTVSIAANTCATPPANVSVNYVLQSVLNP